MPASALSRRNNSLPCASESTVLESRSSTATTVAPIAAHENALLARAFTRAAGAPLVQGNAVRLLKDAAENYPAWLAAIRAAQHRIYFENYFIVDDECGAGFADALSERARAGVKVRLIHDWLGSFPRASRGFWRSMTAAGVEVRSFNPPKLRNPFGWLHRDHRKMLTVDGRVGFVTGLCVGKMWVGDPERGLDPWRDTGIEVRGPALRDVEQAFENVWATMGAPIPGTECGPRESIPEAGSVAVRIVANAPGTTGLFRLDQLIAAAARRTLWLTDAYFAGIAPYVQALRAAALDGVDVRLLVPGSSDIPLLRPLSQTGYRPLLEAGVRLFEWKGPMLHAKTAVADGAWARVGSSNLNVASWIGNFELDAVIENESFAAEMERMYLTDLEYATEIVLQPRRRRIEEGRRESPSRPRLQGLGVGMGGAAGSASRATAGALRLGRTVGAALTEQRVMEPNEARIVAIVGVLLLGIVIAAVLWPFVVAIPVAVVGGWLSIALLARAHSLRRERRARSLPRTRVEPK
jgi:cardiolipin synthase A/B